MVEGIRAIRVTGVVLFFLPGLSCACVLLVFGLTCVCCLHVLLLVFMSLCVFACRCLSWFVYVLFSLVLICLRLTLGVTVCLCWC